MPDIKTIADKADIIINGYAFTREDDGIHVTVGQVHRHFVSKNIDFFEI
jgi:hypothetical protein